MIKLFVGGFPLETQEMEIVQLLSLYGEIATIKIVRDKKTNVCKGYAFIEVTDYQSAKQIIEGLDGVNWLGRLLSIRIVPLKTVQSNKPSYLRVPRPDVFHKPKRPRKQ